MKYFSLFSGIGGFELGIQNAYVEITNRKKDGQIESDPPANDKKRTRLESPPRKETGTEIGWNRKLPNRINDERAPHCVGYSEIDKYATQIYQKWFPNHNNHGDITKIDAATLPDFDILVGGFPCQAFSIAGKRAGFADTRGTLFFDICRLLATKKPRLLLLENVKGLLSHDDGATFKTIIATLDELGYDLQWQVLNSKNHGVPQNRERVFIVGHLRGTPRPEVFPLGEGNQIAETPRGEARERVANTLRAKQGGPDLENSYLIIQKSPDYRKDGSLRTFKENSPTLRSQMGDNHPMVIQRGRGKNNGGAHEIAPTMTGKSYQDNNHVGGIRKLTPTECERLQGFPDGWTEGISDTQRYKTLGNAVTTNVVRDIMKKIL